MFFHGDFTIISPPGLIQLLCQERRSAVIHAWRGEVAARVQLFEGLIVAAECGMYTGEEAVYHMAVWDSGQFQVEAAPDPPSSMDFAAGGEELLLEAARRRDELELALPRLPPYPLRQEIDALLAACPALGGVALVGYDGRLLASVGIADALVHHVLTLAGGLAAVSSALAEYTPVVGSRGSAALYLGAGQRLLLADDAIGTRYLAVPAAGASVGEALGQLSRAVGVGEPAGV
jgi:hypothetical protein